MAEAVRFEQVSKRFIIHHERARTIQEAALNLLRFRKSNGSREEFWALRHVSFSLERGRTLGIVGRNGSGKSTLLKLLAGTMRPTSGRMVANGRVFGLLELAAGFHPELSGRDNVFLNGTFLGFSRRQMAARLDQIVAFAELEQFIDTPVKHYSSGMYMRLGFAIAISVDPDILVIDEVLAVGDAAFRQKCFLALAEFKSRQKTILFVTHDASAVRRFCDEAIWLDHGRVIGAGTAGDVLGEYLAATQSTRGPGLSVEQRPQDPLATPRGPVAITSVETVDASGHPERHFQTSQTAGIRVRLSAEAHQAVSIGVAVHRADGLYLLGTGSGPAEHRMEVTPGEGEAICWLGKLPLAAAEYSVSAAVWLAGERQAAHRLTDAARFAVRPPRVEQAGVLALEPRWETSGAISGTVPPPRDERPIAIGPGQASDQTRPEGAFSARWRRAPSRLTIGQGDDEFLGAGWYPPEDWPPRVRWTARRATAYLTQDEWASAIGITMCRPQHDQRAATGRILIDGRVIARFELAAPVLEPFTFPIDPVAVAKEVEITLEIDVPIEPAAEGASDDRRVLGVAVHEIWLD